MPKELKKQKSTALILFITTVLICVIAIGIYLMQSPPTQSPQPACQYDPDVCTFFSVLQKTNNPSYALTATISTNQPNQPDSQVVIQSDGKDNLSLRSLRNGKLQGESVLYANSLYIKNPLDNSWTVSPIPADSSLRNFRQKTFAEMNKTGVDASYVFIRTTPCGQLTCMKYQRIISKSDPSKTYILFDTKEHRLRQVIIKAASTTTETVFSYDPLTIQRPTVEQI